MFELGQPLLLIAAAGILIPLAIHLWNRRPPRLLATGSIRWFRGSTSRSARSLQLKNWPLLLLRCLLLLVFSLLVAGLFWEQPVPERDAKPSLFLVEAGLAAGKSQSWVDSLAAEGKEARLLAPGLPPLADSLRWKGKRIDIWGLMKEADTLYTYTDTVHMYSPLFQGYFSGERPEVHKHFNLLEPPYPQQPQTYGAGLYQKGDSLVLQLAAYLPERIVFREQALTAESEQPSKSFSEAPFHPFLQADAAETGTVDTFRIRVEADETYRRDAAIVQQAFQLLEGQLPGLRLEFSEEDTPDLLLWFRSDSIPARFAEAGTVVLGISERKTFGSKWLERPEAGQAHYFLPQRPLPERVEREALAQLPVALLELLPAGAEATYTSFLQMPLSQAMPYQLLKEEEKKRVEARSLHLWLWLLLFSLFVVERIWALKE